MNNTVARDQPAISMGHAAGKSVMHGPHDLRAIVPRGIFGWFAPSGPLYETVRPRARGRCLNTGMARYPNNSFIYLFVFEASHVQARCVGLEAWPGRILQSQSSSDVNHDHLMALSQHP